MWNEFTVDRSIDGDTGKIKLVKFAETMSDVSSDHGLSFSPDTDFNNLPHFDILVIPGGRDVYRKFANIFESCICSN